MDTCAQFPTPRRIRIFPGGQSLSVGSQLSSNGESNAFFDVPRIMVNGKALPLLLKTSMQANASADELKQERALMLVAARENMHPVIHALSILHAPFGCTGYRLASLMEREVPLTKLLSRDATLEYGVYLQHPDWCRAIVTSFVGCIFRVSELGFCHIDSKPSHVVCNLEKARCYLLDFQSDTVVWMDPTLVSFYESMRRPHGSSGGFAEERGSSCSKVRGTQLYFMLLLYHMHLTKHFSKSHSVLCRRLRQSLKGILVRSCLPLQLLWPTAKKIIEQALHGDEGDSIFVPLGVILTYHFFRTHGEVGSTIDPTSLRWFLVDYPKEKGLISPECSGKESDVIIDGIVFDDDHQATTGGPREAYLERLEERIYPCPMSSRSRKYSIQNGFPYSRVGATKTALTSSSLRLS